MTTLATLRTSISTDLRDPANQTFTAPVVTDMVNAALAALSPIAPAQFQEDIMPVADTLQYLVQSDTFDGIAVPEIEVVRAEVWDGTTTPISYLYALQRAAGEYVNDSSTGWKMWAGYLELTNAQEDVIDPDSHLIRVWGYRPYPAVSADDDVVPVSAELEQAVRAYCRVEALRRLVLDRDLFTQWQTKSNNTDVSPAALMNGLAQAEEDWRRRERKLLVLRER
ncbi:MAG TPA: hypothetical protein VFI40_04975 [Nocardioides sp.]|nr:hypothetical protein [Nocardioides sp.]